MKKEKILKETKTQYKSKNIIEYLLLKNNNIYYKA